MLRSLLFYLFFCTSVAITVIPALFSAPHSSPAHHSNNKKRWGSEAWGSPNLLQPEMNGLSRQRRSSLNTSQQRKWGIMLANQRWAHKHRQLWGGCVLVVRRSMRVMFSVDGICLVLKAVGCKNEGSCMRRRSNAHTPLVAHKWRLAWTGIWGWKHRSRTPVSTSVFSLVWEGPASSTSCCVFAAQSSPFHSRLGGGKQLHIQVAFPRAKCS